MRTKQFDEGYNARLNGATFEDNPYGVTTFPYSKDYWEWNKGWSTAHVDVLAYGIEKPFEENPIVTQGYEAFKRLSKGYLKQITHTTHYTRPRY